MLKKTSKKGLLYKYMKENKNLTHREIEVLELVADGLSNQDIAEELHISIHTVKAHISSMYRKIETSSRVALAASSLKLGII